MKLIPAVALLLPISVNAQAVFEWPDAQKNGIVLVNSNSDIVTYVRKHPDWFQPGETVLDLAVPNGGDPAASERRRADIVDLLRSKGMTAGTYTSGNTVETLADIKLWPYDKVPLEWMPRDFVSAGVWPGDAQRKIINVTDAQARLALQAGIRRIWQQTAAPLRFVDNAASHSSTGGTQPWPAYCANIHEIRLIGESSGSRVVFNVSVHPAFLAEADAARLIRAVGRGNGILLEDPWGEATRKSPELTRQARARYRELLDAGITIIVLPLNLPVDTLMEWLASFRKPSDKLYLGWSFFKQPWRSRR